MVPESYVLSLSRLSTCLHEVLLENDLQSFPLFFGVVVSSGGIDGGFRLVPGGPPQEFVPTEREKLDGSKEFVRFLFKDQKDIAALMACDTTPQELYQSGLLQIEGPEESALLTTIAMARAWNEEAKG